jgi:hypothetical protein
MIINDRVRKMTPPEKMKHLFELLVTDLPRTKKNEIVEEISKMSKGVKPEDFLETFQLKGEYDSAVYIKGQDGVNKVPTIRVDLEDGQSISIEISELERRWFFEPQPVEPEPPRSFLPKDELDELNSNG